MATFTAIKRDLWLEARYVELQVSQLHWEHPHTRRRTDRPDRLIGIVALQEVCCTGSMVQTLRVNHTKYQSCGNTRELRTPFIVTGDMQKRLIGWWPIDEWMCNARFFNISLINVHSPHSGSTEDDKDAFYEQLERDHHRGLKNSTIR